MTTETVTADDLERMTRWVATASTWTRKAAASLEWFHARTTGQRQWAIGYHAEQLLRAILEAAQRLVPLIPDEFLDDLVGQARALEVALGRRRLAAKLDQVEGRTGPEADAFRTKAAELRR